MAFTTFKALLVAFALVQVSWAQGPDGPDDPDNNGLDRVIAEYELKFQELIKDIQQVVAEEGLTLDKAVSELADSHEIANVAIETSIGALQILVEAEKHVAEEEHRDIRECIENFERFIEELEPKNVEVCRKREEEDKLRESFEELLSLTEEIVLKKDHCLLQHDREEELTQCFNEAIDEGREESVRHAAQVDTEILRITNESDECVGGITQHVKQELERHEQEFTECASRGGPDDGPDDGPNDGPGH